MLRLLALPLAAMVLLSGCSTNAPSGQEGPAPTTAFTITGDNRIVEPLFTDTYHFLAQPGVTPAPPDAVESVRVPVTSLYDRTMGLPAEPPTWDFAIPQDVQALMGTATIWVEVTGTVTGNPFSQTPTGGCFWCLNALVNGELVGLGSLTEDLQVQPGTYELHFTFSYADRSYPAGTEFQVHFTTGEWVARPPGTTVEMLTASIQNDSFLQIYGLELPLETTLLATT
ncbi:MAG: hypothetical protein ACYC2H_04485 [Thermoplasmatota archaeon]